MQATAFLGFALVAAYADPDAAVLVNLQALCLKNLKCHLIIVSMQATVFLGFASPAAYVDPEAAVLTKLYVRLLADALNEIAYPASLAGIASRSLPSRHCSRWIRL